MELSPRRRPPVLSNLPTEILWLILRNFCLHCCEPDWVSQVEFPGKQQKKDQPSWYSLDRQALYSTCLASRRLCDIAQPILYHEFIPGYGDSFLSNRYEWTGRLTCFLRTVALRRDLANLVQTLYISYQLLRRIIIETRQVQAALVETTRIRGVNLSDFLEAFEQQWKHDRPRADALVAMLLSCLPNLTRLHLTAEVAAVSSSFMPASALRAAGVVCLPLRTIEVVAGSADFRKLWGGIFEMSFATLRTLKIHYYHSCLGDKLGFSGLFFPSLRNISLTRSWLTAPDLKLLLSCCMDLDTFTYDASPPTCNYHPSDIIKYLSRHQATLTKLRLDLWDDLAIYLEHIAEPIPSLKIFPVLLDVSLNTLFIYNHKNVQQEDDKILCQLLPPSIVSLRLYDTLPAPTLARLSKGLLGLADAALQGQFPSLRAVECHVREQFYGHDLVLKFASAEVCLDTILWDMRHRRRL